jgi:hypothetical protein
MVKLTMQTTGAALMPRATPAMVRADRELKLARYEVFHFGAEELQHGDSGEIVRSFFELLFKEYWVTVTT